MVGFHWLRHELDKGCQAQVLKGRRITGWKSIIQDIKNSGAEFIDQEVVEDGNIISSRHPGDLPAFIRASLKKLK